MYLIKLNQNKYAEIRYDQEFLTHCYGIDCGDTRCSQCYMRQYLAPVPFKTLVEQGVIYEATYTQVTGGEQEWNL